MVIFSSIDKIRHILSLFYVIIIKIKGGIFMLKYVKKYWILGVIIIICVGISIYKYVEYKEREKSMLTVANAMNEYLSRN